MSFELQFEELESAKHFRLPKIRKRKSRQKQKHVRHINIRQLGLSTGVIILVKRGK